jgi:D-glycero-beta-D-manno-heptose-7-phosphate kinase
MKDILVIGESCRDVFVYCDASRLAPDWPVPVLNIIDQTENVGMAKNVQRNIQTHIDCDILTNSNWQDITKTRYVHEKTNHMFFRVDSTTKVEGINLKDVVFDYKLIVVSDYNKGFLSESDISWICSRHPNVFIDSKKVIGDWASGCKYIKINDFEYQKSKANLTPTLKNKIIHTIGGNGCEFQGKLYRVKKVDVKDTSGAGDSFMAALAIKYVETENIQKSIEYANKCASEVVKYRGVTVISHE